MSLSEGQLSDREIKALQIAAKSRLTQKGNVWLVPSQAGHGEYEVRPDPQAPRCTCPDYEFRNARCKHIVAVEYVLMREEKPDGSTVVTETVTVTSRKTYSQDWKAYNAAQTHEKSELQALLYELCKNLPEPVQQRGQTTAIVAGHYFLKRDEDLQHGFRTTLSNGFAGSESARLSRKTPTFQFSIPLSRK
jgi:hypothetical protein